jgi:hypothetical protein
MLSSLPKKVSSIKSWMILLLAVISFIGINGFAPEYPHYKELNISERDVSYRYADPLLDVDALHECCASEKLRMEEAKEALDLAIQELEDAEEMLTLCGFRKDCHIWTPIVAAKRQAKEEKQAAYNTAKATYDKCVTEHLPITIYVDADRDGLGDKNNSRPGCSGRPVSQGLSLNNEDCDDTSADIRRCGRCCIYLKDDDGTDVKCVWSKTESDCEEAAKASAGNAEFSFSGATHCKMEACPSAQRQAAFLSSLNAFYDKETPEVKIQWKTPDQAEARNFFIQRSRDGERFKTIGIQKNNNATSAESIYVFSDINPLDIGYYRITWTSESKLYSSQAVPVYIGLETNMQLAPNPANGSLRIFLTDMGLYDIEISIFDATGHVVISKKVMGSENELDVSTLTRGFYIIQATQGHKVYREKFYKE